MERWKNLWKLLVKCPDRSGNSVDLWFYINGPYMQLQDSNAVLKKSIFWKALICLNVTKSLIMCWSYDGHSFQFMFSTSVNRSNCSAGQVKGYYSHKTGEKSQRDAAKAWHCDSVDVESDWWHCKWNMFDCKWNMFDWIVISNNIKIVNINLHTWNNI